MKDYKRLTKNDWHNAKFSVITHEDNRAVLHRLWELENKIERGEFIPASAYASARHRAEVAERALLTACVNLIKDEEGNVNMELLARVVYTKYLRKAEQELTEER